jgi:hypothetical protein
MLNRSVPTVAAATGRTHAREIRAAVLSLVLGGLSAVSCYAQAPLPAVTMGHGSAAVAASFAPFMDGSERGSSLASPGSSQNVPPLPEADPSSVLRESDAGMWTPDIGPAAPQEDRSFPVEASWSDGLRFQSNNKQFQFHFGGVVQIDSTWLIGPQNLFNAPGGVSNGVGNSSATFLRRAVLQADGSLYDQFDFCIAFLPTRPTTTADSRLLRSGISQAVRPR